MLLPHLTLRWRPSDQTRVVVDEELFASLPGLHVGIRNIVTKVHQESEGDRAAVAIGCPVLHDIVDPAGVARRLVAEGFRDDFLRSLGGQFLLLLIDRQGRRLQVASDRFTGIPLYWAREDDGWCAAMLYDDLFGHLRHNGGVRLRPEVMIEFIRLQKLMGLHTYDDRSQFLAPASVLSVADGSDRRRLWWRPDFTKSHGNRHRFGEEFTGHLLRSAERLSSDGVDTRYGMMLSGGHDSRCVLAAFPRPLTCFTVGFRGNFEAALSCCLARMEGHPFVFQRIPRDFMARSQARFAALCGGMYATDNALLMGLESAIRESSDVIFHGHGFDYLFQGSYQSARTIHFGGSPTFWRRKSPLGDDLAGHFLENLSFRIKDTDVMEWVDPSWRSTVDDGVRESIRSVATGEWSDGCRTREDQWELLFIYGLSRHYSHPNLASVMCAAQPRTIAFDPDLFDFYLRLPGRYRLHADVMRHAMWRLNPRLAAAPTSNHGLPAGDGPTAKTYALVKRKIRRMATGKHWLAAPGVSDRTYPNRDENIRRNLPYRRRVVEALSDSRLDDLVPCIDWDRLRPEALHWLESTGHGGKFLTSIMTLQGFLARHY